jgi:acyl-CoA synthetase (AMP-forming)/AMP-acid ligase II
MEHNESLFKATKCEVFFYTSPFESLALQIAQLGLQTLKIPSFEEMLQGESKPYSYTTTFEEGKEDIAFICHTSGSTGPPKPVPYAHKWLSILDKHRYIATPPGRRGNVFNQGMGEKDGDRFLCDFPMFHLSGLTAGMECLFDYRTQIRGPASILFTGKMATDILGVMEIYAIYAPLMVFDDIVKNHAAQFSAVAKNTKMAVFAGGSSPFP